MVQVLLCGFLEAYLYLHCEVMNMIEKLRKIFKEYDRALEEITESHESTYTKEVGKQDAQDELIKAIREIIESEDKE